MLMQCAITSGLRRPRNPQPELPAAPPLLQEGGPFSPWGGGGGGEAEGKQRAASGGTLAVEPSPQTGPGGRGGAQHRGRERAPAWGAAGEAQGVIKARGGGTVPPQTHLHSTPPALLFSSLSPDTRYLLNNSAAASHWR